MLPLPTHEPSGWSIQDHPKLFGELRALTVGGMQTLLGQALDNADSWLFEQLKKAPTHAPLLEAARGLRQQRNGFERAFVGALQKGFEDLLAQVNPTHPGELALGLVDDDELQGVLASETLVDAVSAAHEMDFDLLARRLAVMAGVKKLRPALNPLTASHLSQYLQAAQRLSPMPELARGPLFKMYERELVGALGEVLAALNTRLARAGILPELDCRRPSAATTEPDVAPQVDIAELAKAECTYVPENSPGVDVRATFDTLRGLLHRRRPLLAGNVEAPPAEDFGGLELPSTQHTLEDSEVIAVLSLLQSSPPDSVLQAMADAGVSLAERMKQDILHSVGRIGLAPDSVVLTQMHEDAIDLVGMLFGVLFDERDFRDKARHLLARLVVPYAKAAIIDLRLFQFTTHPARRLLNALAEAVEGNRGEGPQERALLAKAESLVERLVLGFERSVGVFEVLENEFKTYLAQHRLRLELAERRASELQRGQERLEKARAQAAVELRERVGGRWLPAALEDFLTRYWAHHIAMVMLREGDDSAAWKAALAVADSLLARLPADAAGAATAPAAVAALGEVLLPVLMSSGVTDAIAAETVAQLASAYALLPPAKPLVTPPPVEPALAHASEATATNDVAAAIAAFVEEDADVSAIRALKLGEWVELAGDDARMSLVKLSWVSPISNNLMFVNRRGVRILVASLDELVAMKKQGKLLLREHAQLFDHAMHRVKSRLEVEVAAAAG